MTLISGLWTYVLPFLVVLTVLVFVHEFGHYWVARRCGVKIESFSIGFGRELFGFNDRSGTRWKVCMLPFGGYVKMYGDADGSSAVPSAEASSFTEPERSVSFVHKTLAQKAAIVVAGPAANFLFTIVVLGALFATVGQPVSPPVVAGISDNSAAAEAGLETGDKIVSINGATVRRFEDMQRIVALSAGEPLTIVYQRGGETREVTARPHLSTTTDRFGFSHTMAVLGVKGGGGGMIERLDPVSAAGSATRETWNIATGTLKAVGQMIIGVRGTEDVGGPLRIAQLSGQVAKDGFVSLVEFMAVLSVNLGLINLFPIPMLDGGHLLFYALEGARGRPLGERVLRFGYRVGLAVVLAFAIFATWNDITHVKW